MTTSQRKCKTVERADRENPRVRSGRNAEQASHSTVEPSVKRIAPRMGWYFAIKPLIDACLAVFLLIPALPIMLIAAAAIKLTSKGPVIYRQTRVGLGGRHFTLLKLRSMVVDAEAGSGAVWCTQNDPRVTKVGAFLRKTHIDEFPQLFNVLLGQMSLVGPRPERPEFVQQFETELPHYRDRHNVKPGITGLAQLRLPPDTDLESVRLKLVHDLFYVDRVDAWMDFRLLERTVWRLVRECLSLEHERASSLPSSKIIHAHVRRLINSAEPHLQDAEFGESAKRPRSVLGYIFADATG